MADLDYGMSMAQPPPGQGQDSDFTSAFQMGLQNPHAVAGSLMSKQAGAASSGDALTKAIKGPDNFMQKTFGGAPAAARPNPMKKVRNENEVTPEKQQDYMQSLLESPMFKDAISGIDKGQDQSKQLLSMTPSSNNWIRTVAALGDQLQRDSGHPGANMAEQIPNNGISPAERAQLLLKYQDEAQKRKEDLIKTITSAGSNYMKSGDKTQITVGDPNMMGGLGGQRRQQLIYRIGNDYDQHLDPTMKVIGNLERAHNILNSSATLTTKMFNTASQDAINAVAQGNATEGKVGREMPGNLATEISEFLSHWGNDPRDIREIPGGRKLVKQYADFVDSVKGDYQDYGERKAGLMKVNSAATNDPDMMDASERKYNQYHQIFTREKPKPADITPGEAPSRKVQVTNGKETLEIPESDVQAAQKDGYRVK